jgi:dihydrofolate reductase
MERRVILYIAMSLDGFIAKEDDNIDFLTTVELPGEDYGYSSFLKDIDTVIWGRKTYDKVLTLSTDYLHKDKKVYVLSRSRTGTNGNIEYVNDIKTLIHNLRKKEGLNIYCDGGSEIVFELLKHSLIDKLIVSVIPHLLGSGIRLFKEGLPEHKLKFKQSISYPSGLVQLWYEKGTGKD